jgi:2-polyprenyl-3-methyl-5-hydroxy-6-metoxy-1,4-benzoquinol methylase
MGTHPTNYKKDFIAQNGKLELSHCHHCGFAHIQPERAKKETYYLTDTFYKDHSPPDWFKKEEKEYPQWKPFFRHLESFYQDKSLPIIDIGCGAGWFSKYLVGQGWETYNVEPSLEAREIAKINGLTNIYESLPQLPGWVKGHIYLGLVLEHVDDPKRFLKLCLYHLSGRIIIVVPNELNLLQKQAEGSWFIQDVHRNYFAPDTLRELLKSVGLKTVWEGATFPMELFLLNGLDYRDDEEKGRIAHEYRLKQDAHSGAFIFYHLLYKALGIGRELIFVAEKA